MRFSRLLIMFSCLLATLAIVVEASPSSAAVGVTLDRPGVTTDTVVLTGRAGPLTRVRLVRRTADGWKRVGVDRTDRLGEYRVELERPESEKWVVRAVSLGERSRRRSIKPVPPPADACGSRVQKADGTWWECSFVDDFNETTIDATRWTVGDTATNWNGLGTGNCHLASNVWVADGMLHLKSTVTPEPITCRYPSGHTFQTRRTSAEVYTMDKHAQTYGRWEIRARFPAENTHGISALWMWPQNKTYGAWPRNGEIDIVERMPTPGSSQWAYNSVHYLDASGGTSYAEGDGDGNPGESGVCTVDMTQWHVYAVTWSDTKMRFTVDGNKCSSMGWDPLDLVGPAPFDQPFYLRLLQAGRGDADVAQHRVTEVDWVRVYR